MTRRASSLVLVTLTMAAVAVVILAGSRALVQSLRTRSNLDSISNARALAEAAIQEGMQRARKGDPDGGLANYNQYGSWNVDLATLEPVTRGFSTTDCTTVAEVNYVESCGTYQLAVRTVVKATSYSFQAQDLPDGFKVLLDVPRAGSMGFRIRTNTSFSGLQFDIEQYNGSTWGAALTNQRDLSVSNTVQAIALTVRYGVSATPPTATDAVIIVESTGGGDGAAFAIQKGFTTVEGTGLAADGTQYRSVAILRPNFAGGFEVPAPGPMPVDPDAPVVVVDDLVSEANRSEVSQVLNSIRRLEKIPYTLVAETNGTGGYAPATSFLIRRNISPTFSAAGLCEPSPYQNVCR